MNKTEKKFCANESAREHCGREASHGHVFCNPCRVNTGGYSRKHERYVGNGKVRASATGKA